MLTLYAWPDMGAQGEHLEVKLSDGRRYKFWVVLTRGSKERDLAVRIIDYRSASEIRRDERKRWESR